MWLYLIAGFLILFGVIAGALGGGIFTIVLLPLGLIALATAFFAGGASRGAQKPAQGTQTSDPTDRALPHSHPADPGRVTGTPEQLADARRAQQ